MMNYTVTDEAKAVRAQRRKQRTSQADDPLFERARLIAFWRGCGVTNRQYIPHNGAWWYVFIWQPHWRKLVMPKLRARLDARDKDLRDRYQAELQESSRRWALVKAERLAAKKREKSPQRQLLEPPTT
jgi:hypothetical protein